MRWDVKGVDRESGHERVLVVDGADEREAALAASRAGMLVESCSPINGELGAHVGTLDYGGRRKPGAAKLIDQVIQSQFPKPDRPGAVLLPDFSTIVAARARRLRRFAVVFFVISIFQWITAAFEIVGFLANADSRSGSETVGELLLVAIAGTGMFALIFAAGSTAMDGLADMIEFSLARTGR